MRLGVLFSGGKDSSYALYLSLEQGFEVSCLITLRPSTPESYMFHHPNIDLTRLHAEAMGLPLILRETEARKEEELKDLAKALQEAKTKTGIEGVVTGAIDSDYQKTRIDRVTEETRLRSFAPLWRKNPSQLLSAQLAAGFRAIISGVNAYGFGKEWLGKPFNEETNLALLELRDRFGIHPSGEGGEYESSVLDAPVFKQKVIIDESSVEWDAKSGSGTFRVLRAHLEPKGGS